MLAVQPCMCHCVTDTGKHHVWILTGNFVENPFSDSQTGSLESETAEKTIDFSERRIIIQHLFSKNHFATQLVGTGIWKAHIFVGIGIRLEHNGGFKQEVSVRPSSRRPWQLSICTIFK